MLVPAVSSMHALPECETNASEIYLRKNLPSKKAFNKFSNPGWVGGGGVHHLESKCHVDLKSNFFISSRGTLPRITMSL